MAVMEGHNVTCTLATDDIATPPDVPGESNAEGQGAQESEEDPSAGRTKLVRKISVGEGQTASVTVKILPKKARKTVTVKKTKQRVVVHRQCAAEDPGSGCGSPPAAAATHNDLGADLAGAVGDEPRW